MVEPFLSQITTSHGTLTCYCVAIRARLRSGDRFHCSNCDNGAPSAHANPLPMELDEEEATTSQSQRTLPATTSQSQLTSAATSQTLAQARTSIRDLFSQVSFELARNEVLTTFSSRQKVAEYQKLGRGPTPLPATATCKGCASSNAPGSSRLGAWPPVSSGKQFCVSKLGILICGIGVTFKSHIRCLQKTGELRVTKFPTRPNCSNELQRMKNRGCYIDEVTSVDSTWTYEQTSTKLAEWFPQVFEYIRHHQLNIQTSGWGNVLPWWRLLSKSGFSLNVVEAVYPTGADLLQNKGWDKAGVGDSQLWFGTCYLLRISITTLT
ncbi:hypothetical protein JVT61DRAFT_6156 [Boletus reticuloceps]|uniref:Uncharacterized protein n=1 Tax=Boletus reticuloceps TaxID=495285 RepID=A0A8I3A803_9AGAM|nr:hypothetical protein JVT61DRAFT_6156 [Boletus reticuloceps]